MDESETQNAEPEKADAKKYVLPVCCVTFRNRQNEPV